MDEKEKELMPDNGGVQYENNDNWKFDASAPTLESNLELEGGYEISMASEKSAQTEPEKNAEFSNNNDKIVLSKAPLKIALGVIVAAAVIAVLCVLGVRYYTLPNSDEKMNPGNVAVTVGDTDVSIGMYNYYYTITVYNYLDSADIDTTADYATQYTVDDDGNKISWLDKFKQDTIKQIKYYTAFYDQAVKAGVTLNDNQKKTIDDQMASMASSASTSGMSINEYISSNYGDYCGAATMRKFMEQMYIIGNYYNVIRMDLKPSQEELDTFIDNHIDDYKLCYYGVIEIPYDTDGGKTKEESIEAAKKYCEEINDLESMKKIIPEACEELINQIVSYGYFQSADQAVEQIQNTIETSSTKTELENNYGADIAEWLFSNETEVGSTTFSVDEDYSCVTIMLKTSQPKLDETELYSVRHILVMPESEAEKESEDTTDDAAAADDTTVTENTTAADTADGQTSSETEYTEEEWASALTRAEEILEKYNSGDKTEKSFAALAEKYSDDTESTSSGSSGLYGGAFEGTSLGRMVSEFEGWATDDSRKYGDVEIVKSEFGYHIMYFMFDGPTYIYNAENDLISEKEEEYVNNYKFKECYAISKTKVAQPTANASNQTAG